MAISGTARRARVLAGAVSPPVLLSLVLLLGVTWLVGQEAQRNRADSVKPGINKNFLNPELVIEDWLGRFEVESREVYHCQKEIIEQLGIEKGMAVADIGAGTGLYMEPFAERVGPNGKVFSVDIAPVFIKHLKTRAERRKLNQVTVVKCAEDSVSLPENSVDVAFICDTYHHFEYPGSTLASLLAAMKPGGRVAVIDFERIPGVTREWLLNHVRAGKDVFVREIEEAGFEKEKELTLAGLKENYFVIFRKPS